jgi:hypothetical protein
MSAASDKILAEINAYIEVMKGQGKMPTTIYLTRKQFIDLKNGLGKANDDDWKPRIRSIPIEVVKQ